MTQEEEEELVARVAELKLHPDVVGFVDDPVAHECPAHGPVALYVLKGASLLRCTRCGRRAVSRVVTRRLP